MNEQHPDPERPVRYVVPDREDGGWPEMFVWHPGTRRYIDRDGNWADDSGLVDYESALSWDEARAALQQQLDRQQQQWDAYVAFWTSASPDEVVNYDAERS